MNKLTVAVFINLTITFIFGLFFSNLAEADNIRNLVSNAHVSGNVRLYNWDDHNRYQTNVGDNTLSLGGRLIAHSGKYYGLSAVFGFYTAHSLGLNSNLPGTSHPVLIAPDRAPVNPTLSPTIDVLGQAYLQWENKYLSIRAGDQPLNTPFANSADYRMIPVLYQGVRVGIHPIKQLTIVGARIFRFKDWVSSSFTRNNSFIWNGIKKRTPGFWVVGGILNNSFDNISNTFQSWFYQFYDYANFGYIKDVISFNQKGQLQPYIGLEAGRETSAGSRILGPVNSTLFGGKIGARYKSISAHISAMHLMRRANAYADGGLASPYTNFYGSSHEFTQQTMYSTEAFGAGSAYQTAVGWQVNKRLSTGLNYTFFSMGANPGNRNDISEFSGDISYNFKGNMRGLTITEVPSVAYSPGGRTFLQSRLMMQYNF